MDFYFNILLPSSEGGIFNQAPLLFWGKKTHKKSNPALKLITEVAARRSTDHKCCLQTDISLPTILRSTFYIIERPGASSQFLRSTSTSPAKGRDSLQEDNPKPGAKGEIPPGFLCAWSTWMMLPKWLGKACYCWQGALRMERSRQILWDNSWLHPHKFRLYCMFDFSFFSFIHFSSSSWD